VTIFALVLIKTCYAEFIFRLRHLALPTAIPRQEAMAENKFSMKDF
jgi:hypothetical protein